MVAEGVVLHTRRVKPRAIKARTRIQEHDRIDEILTAITDMAARCPYNHLRVGIEGPSYGSKGASVHQVAGLWWAITQRLYQLELPYYVITPSQRMKYATGKGQADKDIVLAAVINRYRDLVEVTGNDIADSLIIAAMGARHYGSPLEHHLPELNLKAMEAVEWSTAE
jgi:Holliday junction resolvasome RuvABC endonuclease subunit